MFEQKPNRIVAGGRARVRTDCRREVEVAVCASYADELARARGLRRLLLQRRVRREIERRLDDVAPQLALYVGQEPGAEGYHALRTAQK